MCAWYVSIWLQYRQPKVPVGSMYELSCTFSQHTTYKEQIVKGHKTSVGDQWHNWDYMEINETIFCSETQKAIGSRFARISVATGRNPRYGLSSPDSLLYFLLLDVSSVAKLSWERFFRNQFLLHMSHGSKCLGIVLLSAKTFWLIQLAHPWLFWWNLWLCLWPWFEFVI